MVFNVGSKIIIHLYYANLVDYFLDVVIKAHLIRKNFSIVSVTDLQKRSSFQVSRNYWETRKRYFMCAYKSYSRKLDGSKYPKLTKISKIQ